MNRQAMSATIHWRRSWSYALLLTGFCLAFASSNTQAQSGAGSGTIAVNGKINAFKGQVLLIDTDRGPLAVKLAENAIIRAEVPIKVSEISPGMYVGATATKQPDGTFRMSRLHVFSEDQRGVGEGHRPLSSAPQSGATMTNANVDAIDDVLVQNVTERVLTLKYKSGELKVAVPPDIPVVKRVLGDASLLKPGAVVSVQARRTEEDSLSASQITVRATGK